VFYMATKRPLRAVVTTNVKAQLDKRRREHEECSHEWLSGQTGIALRSLDRRLANQVAWTTDDMDAIETVFNIPEGSLTRPPHA